MRTAIVKVVLGTRHEVSNGAGYQHLPGSRQAHHSGSDVHRQTGDPVWSDLNFAGVHSGTNLNTNLPHVMGDRHGAADCPSRAVKHGEEPVPCVIDLTTTEPIELTPHHRMMSSPQPSPAAVAYRRRVFRRTNDIGEQDGSEYPVGLRTMTDSGEELLDLVNEPVEVPGGEQVVPLLRFDVSGSGNVRGEIAAVLHGHIAIADAMQNEGRYADNRKHVPDVDLAVHSGHG